MFRSSEGRRGEGSEQSLERLSNHVRVLAERVDTLAQTVWTTADAAARQVREELSARLQRVGLEHRPRAEEIPIGADLFPFRGSET